MFNGIADKRPIGEIADLAVESGMHGLYDAIDAHAWAFEAAAGSVTGNGDEEEDN